MIRGFADMKIAIDDSLRADGAQPFLFVWRVPAAAAPDSAAIAARLAATGEAAAAGDLAEAEAAVERYRVELVKLGRNPNRYRISSDALFRRCRRDGAPPSILPLVDLNNILSLRTGWPIGCYDTARIEGDVTYRLGGEGETMASLGKGDFDIARLPILADAAGPFGSTVSDSVRTSVTEAAQEAVFVMYGYGAPDAAALAELVAQTFAEAGMALAEPPVLVG